MSPTKKSFLTSIVALVLCLTMFLGTTFAWFTDIVVSGGNIIQSGKLDAEMYWSDEYLASTDSGWTQVKDNKPIFTYDNWEPGYTEIKYIKVANAGNLNFKWKLSIEAEGKVTDLSDVIDVYYVNPVNGELTKQALAARTPDGKLTDVLANKTATEGDQLTPGGSVVLAIAFHMDELAGNEYQEKSLCDKGFSLKLLATQATGENDSFGDDYDKEAQWPENTIIGNTASAPAENVNGLLGTAASMTSADGKISANVPAGTKLDAGASKLTLNVANMDKSKANITLDENEASLSIDVHILGVAKDNEIVMEISVKELLPVGLNMGNYRFYHVENGQTVEMTLLEDGATPVHNNYEYDPATGDVVLYLKSFSEVALVADTENAWEGNLDYSWYTETIKENPEAKNFVIANADQLAAFGAIVGGMKKVTGRVENKYTYSEEVIQDSFENKTVKLIADINLGDGEEANNPNIIFYPIGYWNEEGTYEKSNKAISSGFYNFCGTFDGNGNTVSNFYQNTWEMKGDHNWYDASLQYYRDGMGLFGKVYGGTVKNLTVRNFKSDGEITTTGTIAAYADGATFENIAIFECNPRVYNIGNGGIVGCVGWYAKEANLKTTFKNITVDNSNKISALWGSYDVACGGIVGQYYPTSGQTSANKPANGGIHFDNCHISAVMDVYNDVCANYQYYAYRYTGMLIGSVRENVTIDGHSYPKMDGITASGCTVHFGTWNDYYYCEIIDNTTASYTHDYQMSRLTEIKAIDGTTITYLDGTTGTVPASGRANYVIVDYTKGHGTENATCYHFKDGAVWTHDMGGIQTGIDEDGDGQDDLKEDKQHIYLEFNNLVTGYGWGVTTKSVGDLAGVTILDREVGNSVEKFKGKVTELANNKIYKFGDIFTFVDNGVELVPGALAVSVTNLDENNPVSATIDYDRTKWENGTITFAGAGKVTITIQDYYFCTPTTITVDVTERDDEEKFDVVMNNGDFLHRVGNVGTVPLDRLFKAKDGVTVGTVSVTVTPVSGNGVSGTYSNNAIQFNGTGVVKVTITDNDYCTPTELILEVVDAVNATSTMNATANNVVLLNDIDSGFTVSGEYTFYGNGFTLNYTGDGRYLNNGLKHGIVTVSENGTLDNLHIKASIYPTAFMYYGKTSLGDYVQQESNPREVDGEKTRYYYQLSSVVAKGNATVQNCYIYGGRTNVFVDTGNVTIKDSILECGTVSNVQIQSTAEYTVTLENVTTIQYQVNATIGDTSKVMLGTGVLVGPDTASNPTIILNGEFKQYNWVTADDGDKVSADTAKMIINGAVNATAYNHTINGNNASNLGIIYMNQNDALIKDNTGLPYKLGDVTMSYSGANVNGQVYSLQNATVAQIYSDYENADRTTVNGDYIPRFDFDLGDQAISYDGSEDTRYLYGDKNGVIALYQDGEAALTLDLTKLATIYKYDGINYTITATCKDSNGNILTANKGTVTLDAQGDYIIEFTVNDNIFYNKNGETILKSVERTYSVSLNLTVKEASVKNAVVNITNTALDGVYNTVNLNDYELRIKFLDCISITDYDNKGNGTTVNLSSNISSATLTPSGANVFSTAFTVTITYTDGRVLTVNFSKISGSSPGTKTGKVNTSGSVYFTTEGALNNKPTEASSQNKCTITSVSFKGNSGSTVTNDTDVAVTWALDSGSSGGGPTCLAAGTMITLADGSKKAVEDLRKGDMVMSFDHLTGEIVYKDVIIVVKTAQENYHKNTFVFDDGTELVTINEHGIFDLDLNKYVNIDHLNYAEYLGHNFVSIDSEGNIGVKKLVDVTTVLESGYKYDIVTNGTLNYVAEDTLSVTHVLVDVINSFDFGADLKYDAEKMQADIEKYGLYDYAEWEEYCDISVFDQYNIPVMKVGISKGLYTKEYIISLINTYVLDDSVQIID